MELYKRLLVDRWGRRKDNFDWRVHQEPLDLASVESALVLHLNDKLGDGLVISLLVDALAEARPDLSIAIGTTAGFVEYWRRHPRVREVIALPCGRKQGRRSGRRIREAKGATRPLRGRFGVTVSFEPYAHPDHFALVRGLAASINMGFNKHPYRLFTHFLEERRHGIAAESVTMWTARVMDVFGHEVDCRALRLHAPFESEDERAIQPTLDGLAAPGARLLFNAYGFGPEKRLSPVTVARGIREIRHAGYEDSILLSVPPGTDGDYERALSSAGVQSGMTAISPVADFFKLFALVSAMDIVVPPDTGVGHIAAAFRKPQVCLFAEGGTIPVA